MNSLTCPAPARPASFSPTLGTVRTRISATSIELDREVEVDDVTVVTQDVSQ